MRTGYGSASAKRDERSLQDEAGRAYMMRPEKVAPAEIDEEDASSAGSQVRAAELAEAQAE
jgi:hypothetical protein